MPRRKKAVEEANVVQKSSRTSKVCTDHKGNQYGSVQEMCEAYGLSYKIYYARKDRNWDLEKILETPVRERKAKAAKTEAAAPELTAEISAEEVAEAPVVEAEAPAEAAVEEAAPVVEEAAPAVEEAAPAVEEAAAVVEEAAEVVEEAAEVVEEVKKPARRGRRKKAEIAEAAPAEEKKPARRGRKKKEEAVAAKAEEKKPARRGRKKAEKKAEDMKVYIQSAMGGEIALDEILSRIGKADAIYIKPEDNAAYYTRSGKNDKIILW